MIDVDYFNETSGNQEVYSIRGDRWGKRKQIKVYDTRELVNT